MSQNVMFVSLGWKSMSTLFMTIALYFSKKSDQRNLESQYALQITNMGEKGSKVKDVEESV